MEADKFVKLKVKNSRQTLFGILIASAVVATWIMTHIHSVFYFKWGIHAIISGPLCFLAISWLYVGLFITAHDCMHGSLAPSLPRLNDAIGRLCLFLYIGFFFSELKKKHYLHHHYSGTVNDPDFYASPPHGFCRWYWSFLTEYFGWSQLLFIIIVAISYLLVFNVSFLNLLFFWAMPALGSSLQLFYFGTYLPHRPEKVPFADSHLARSNNYNWLVSLLTCFHFGYHYEHHCFPNVPWWNLPAIRGKS
ncbi:MAG: hypothetical protein TECD_00780 [Hyphomicrobiaceae bacterium hypho_1]